MRPVLLPLRLQDGLRSDWLPGFIGGGQLLVTAVTTFFIAVYLGEDLDFSGLQIGVCFALHAVTGLVAAFPVGMGSDRLTSKSLVGLGLLGQAAGLLAMSVTRSFGPFVAAYFVWSLSAWVFKLSLDVQLLKTDRGHRTGARVGQYHGFRVGGLLVGSVLTGHLVAGADFPGLLRMVALGCAAMSVLALALPPTPVSRVHLRDYAGDVRDRRVLLFSAWMFLFALHWGAEATSYGLFLRHELSLGLDQMGWYMAAEYAAVIAAVVIAGRRADTRDALPRIALFGLLASGIGHIGMVHEPALLSVAFRFMHGTGDGAMLIVLYLGIARLFAVERVGGNAGFVNTVTMAGYTAGALCYGPLGETFGYGVPFWSSGLVTVCLALPLVGRLRLAPEALPGKGPTPAS